MDAAPDQKEGQVNYACLMKGPDRWVFIYRDGQESQVLKMIGDEARDPENPMTWHGAALLSNQIRKNRREPSSDLPADT